MTKINYDSIPSILVSGVKLYNSREVYNYLEMFADVFSQEVIQGAATYFSTRAQSNLVSEEQIEEALTWSNVLKEMEQEKKNHLLKVEQARKDELMKFSESLVGIHIPEINATFTLPINYSSLTKEALSTIGTGKPTFPVGYLRYLLEQPEVESEFTLWGGTRIYMQGALNSIPEVKYVIASKVNEAILDASKAYISKLNTIAPR